MKENSEYMQQTDTHLAKKYNDALYDCIMRCNMTGYVNESSPHFNNLEPFYAAIKVFFKNTFMLFEGVPFKDENGNNISLMNLLITKMETVKIKIQLVRTDQRCRTKKYLNEITKDCDSLQMLIMHGLQKRKMLVRTSEREPTGQKSISYWDTKVGFSKGGINDKINKKVEVKIGNKEFH